VDPLRDTIACIPVKNNVDVAQVIPVKEVAIHNLDNSTSVHEETASMIQPSLTLDDKQMEVTHKMKEEVQLVFSYLENETDQVTIPKDDSFVAAHFGHATISKNDSFVPVVGKNTKKNRATS